jgi:GNAT superfamily N-acetyltransferase
MVERVRELPSDLGSLVTESELAGMQLVRRLADDWVTGRNRFDGPGEAFFTARIEGRLAGVCGLNTDPYTNAGGVGRVRHLYVLSTYRQRRVAHLLMDRVIAAARESFDILRLRTSNPAAARLYEKLGFDRTDSVEDCSHLMNLKR